MIEFGKLSRFDKKTFGYNVAPVTDLEKLPNIRAILADPKKAEKSIYRKKLTDPIRRVESFENSEEIWKKIETGVRFFQSYQHGRPPRLGSAELLIRAARLSVSCIPDSKIGEIFGGAPTMVIFNARGTVRKAMEAVLTKEEKQTIDFALDSESLGNYDWEIIQRIRKYRLLPQQLRDSQRHEVLEDHPDLVKLIDLLSEGYGIEAIFEQFGIKNYCENEYRFYETHNALEEFLYPDENPSQNGNGRYLADKYFFKRLAFSRLFSLSGSESKTAPRHIERLHVAMKRLSEMNLGNNRVLVMARRFIHNISVFEAALMKDKTGIGRSPAAYLNDFRSLKTLPAVALDTLEGVLLGKTAQEMASEWENKGVPLSHVQLRQQMLGFLHFAENTLLTQYALDMPVPLFIQELSRNRKQEIYSILQTLADFRSQTEPDRAASAVAA